MIRTLWQGGVQSHRGRHYEVENARIYDLPDQPPPILVSGFGPKSTELAAPRSATATAPSARRGSGRAVPRRRRRASSSRAALKVCWGADEASARQTATGCGPTRRCPASSPRSCRRPRTSSRRASSSREDMVAEAIPCGPDLDGISRRSARMRTPASTSSTSSRSAPTRTPSSPPTAIRCCPRWRAERSAAAAAPPLRSPRSILSLRSDHVLRIRRRLEARPEDPQRAHSAPAPAAPRRPPPRREVRPARQQRGAARGQTGRAGLTERSTASARVVGLAVLAEALFIASLAAISTAAPQRQPARRGGVLRAGSAATRRGARAQRRARREHERELPPRLVPDRHRGVGDQRGGVGRQRQAEERRGRLGDPRRAREPAGPRVGRGERGARARRAERSTSPRSSAR